MPRNYWPSGRAALFLAILSPFDWFVFGSFGPISARFVRLDTPEWRCSTQALSQTNGTRHLAFGCPNVSPMKWSSPVDSQSAAFLGGALLERLASEMASLDVLEICSSSWPPTSPSHSISFPWPTYPYETMSALHSFCLQSGHCTDWWLMETHSPVSVRLGRLGLGLGPGHNGNSQLKGAVALFRPDWILDMF